ncbi:MAG TPA: hypothetical protein VF874_17920 [Mycobacterium sp.]
MEMSFAVLDPTALAPSDEQIAEAILAALPADGAPVLWTRIRTRLPGSHWSRETTLLRLHTCGEVRLRKFQRALFVSLGDDVSRETACRARAGGRVLQASVVA